VLENSGKCAIRIIGGDCVEELHPMTKEFSLMKYVSDPVEPLKKTKINKLKLKGCFEIGQTV